MHPAICIGTSGWIYPHWKGVFYPEKLPQSKWLEFYADQFSSVELNATFYHLPRSETFANWHRRTPEHFLWAVKASRYITHIKKLNEPQEPLARLYAAVSGLKEKLGPILFQLPPSLSFHEEIFRDFCRSLNPAFRYALEVRNVQWLNDTLFAILAAHNIAFCIADTAGRYPYHEAVTADFVYVRLHGSQALYASEYSEAELKRWAQKITHWAKDAFVYFDNDYAGYAVKNARRLKEICNRS